MNKYINKSLYRFNFPLSLYSKKKNNKMRTKMDTIECVKNAGR